MRKQAETEELARKVDALSAENVALKSEISQLTENSSTLKLENATLMDKLKNTHVGRMEEIMMNIDDKRSNLLVLRTHCRELITLVPLRGMLRKRVTCMKKLGG